MMHKVGAILASNLLAVCPRYPLPPPPLTPDPEPYLLPISVSSEIVTTFFFVFRLPFIYLFFFFHIEKHKWLTVQRRQMLDGQTVRWLCMDFFFSYLWHFFLYTHNGRNAIVLFNSTSQFSWGQSCQVPPYSHLFRLGCRGRNGGPSRSSLVLYLV